MPKIKQLQVPRVKQIDIAVCVCDFSQSFKNYSYRLKTKKIFIYICNWELQNKVFFLVFNKVHRAILTVCYSKRFDLQGAKFMVILSHFHIHKNVFYPTAPKQKYQSFYQQYSNLKLIFLLLIIAYLVSLKCVYYRSPQLLKTIGISKNSFGLIFVKYILLEFIMCKTALSNVF